MKVTVTSSRIAGEVLIPASKSHTIRALLIASLAEVESTITNPLDSADTVACVAACRAFGAMIEERNREGVRELVVRGTGGRIAATAGTIDVLNSGTTLYLAAGLAALGNSEVSFDGDEQIRSRPIDKLLGALSDLGAEAEAIKGNGCAPVRIKGPLRGGHTSIECPTSQYLSSLLIACPLAIGDSEIEVTLLNEQPYAEMTLRWLDEQGIRYRREGFERFFIPGRQQFHPFSKAVPGDFSSASFFLCAAAVTGSTLTLRGLDMEDSQGDKAVVGMLERMGCDVRIEQDAITISGPGAVSTRSSDARSARDSLIGADLDLNATPDALPALAVTACFARGTTRLLNVPQARLKETDRIAVMAQELSKMGAKVEELPDGLVIHGRDAAALPRPALRGAEVDGRHDHRVVMALAIGALGAEGATTIDTAEAAGVTFPGFFELLESVRKA